MRYRIFVHAGDHDSRIGETIRGFMEAAAPPTREDVIAALAPRIDSWCEANRGGNVQIVEWGAAVDDELAV